MRFSRLSILLITCTVIASGAIAGAFEVPPITPADFAAPASPEAHWIWTLLASEVVAVIAGWLYLQISERLKNSRYIVAITAIKDAVAACYQEYVRAIKAARTDGKLTIEEKNNALNMAYRNAVQIARTRGVDLLKIFAKETVLRLIEKYVSESKLQAVLPPPLPDLAP
ncbi:MAG: hypothetical protein LUC93_06530 [Planctomycetaceae bacterium]|nr:hypothetical protein [Planctomycetaceae bacterium]